MPFAWFKDRRRRELLTEPFPAVWCEHLVNNVRHYACLDRPKQATVQAVVRVLVAEKHWSGGPGLAVTDEMKVTVAAQASLLVLGLDEPYYFDRAESIILHPAAYVRPRQLRRYFNVYGGTLAGEAWYHSPIVLSWQHVLRAGRNQSNGSNVVLHEFAHHLDGLDGEMDGTPPLVGRQQERTWYRVTETEYRRLVGAARRKEVTLLNQYGATNRAEFFAVATECFFERPHAMRQGHAELYAVLRDFYRQDPAEWLPDAAVAAPDKDQRAADADQQADAAALQSDDPDELFMLAVACLDDGRYGLAEKAASRAIDLDPADGEAYEQRALARIKLGNYAAALKDCNRAIEIDGSDMDAYRTRAAAYVGLQRHELAIEDLDQVLRYDKTDAEAYRLRGAALAGMDQFDRAVADFSASIARNPLSAEAYYGRALAYHRLGRSDDVEADLDKAYDLDPQVGRRR